MNGPRPVISYEDITLPYSAVDANVAHPGPAFTDESTSKKRKSNNKSKKRQNKRPKPNQPAVTLTQIPHPGANTALKQEEYEEEDYEEESRELTHEEIWDDSALIDAWNAASEEYDVFNGPDKGWKSQPVHKSPLWYNVPPEKTTTPPPQKKGKLGSDDSVIYDGHNGVRDDQNSNPINFDTFIPTHDASLSFQDEVVADANTNPYEISNVPGISAATPFAAGHLREILSGSSMVSQDEAFTRALGAMYWGGYWTAMYHCQRSRTAQTENTGLTSPSLQNAAACINVDDGEFPDDDDDTDGDQEDHQFLSTQR